MLTEIIYLIVGAVIGLVISFLILRKKTDKTEKK